MKDGFRLSLGGAGGGPVLVATPDLGIGALAEAFALGLALGRGRGLNLGPRLGPVLAVVGYDQW